MADLQLSFSDEIHVYHKILKLFLGIYDQEQRVEGKATSYYRHRIKTQEQLAKLIKEASNGRDKPTQSAISKALDYLKGKDIHYQGRVYRLGKIDGVYRFLTSDDFVNKAKIILYDMQPFLKDSVFFNSASKAFNSTIFGFKVTEEDAPIVAGLFEQILGDSCFEISIEQTLLLIYLDANSDKFKENSDWLMHYFEFQKERERKGGTKNQLI